MSEISHLLLLVLLALIRGGYVMTFGGVVFARGRDIVKEQNFNQQPANHMSASCEPAFVNFLKAKTQKRKPYSVNKNWATT